MPDGMGAGDIFRSRILGQGLEDTPYPQQAVSGMMGGMQPEQLRAFFQSPQVQQQFQQFGIDPQAMMGGMRQSPFFSNQFMGQHPMLGNMLSHGMANAAATPEAPLVSGAGSGVSRAMQGMYGGPEMLRQYQLHQMMGPFGALASMMPTFGEQRRRAIEEAIVRETQQRMGAFPQQMQDLDIQRTEPRVTMGPYGRNITEYQRGAPEGGQQGVDFQMGVGESRPMTSPSGPGAGQQFQMPGFGLTPQQQAGWTTRYEPYSSENVQNVHPERAPGAELKKEQKKTEQTKQTLNKAKAGQADRSPGTGRGGASNKDYSKDYDAIEKDITPRIQALQRAALAAKTKEEKDFYQGQINELNQNRETRKASVDRQRGDPGASQRGLIAPDTTQTKPAYKKDGVWYDAGTNKPIQQSK